MRALSFVGLVLVAPLLSVLPSARFEYYKVEQVKRVEANLYRGAGDIYIETQYCYHYTYGETVLLRWEGKYGTNSIVWDDNSTCAVKNAWKR